MRHIDSLSVQSAVLFTQLECKHYIARAVSICTVNLPQQIVRSAGQARLQITTLAGAQCVYAA